MEVTPEFFAGQRSSWNCECDSTILLLSVVCFFFSSLCFFFFSVCVAKLRGHSFPFCFSFFYHSSRYPSIYSSCPSPPTNVSSDLIIRSPFISTWRFSVYSALGSIYPVSILPTLLSTTATDGVQFSLPSTVSSPLSATSSLLSPIFLTSISTFAAKLLSGRWNFGNEKEENDNDKDDENYRRRLLFFLPFRVVSGAR